MAALYKAVQNLKNHKNNQKSSFLGCSLTCLSVLCTEIGLCEPQKATDNLKLRVLWSNFEPHLSPETDSATLSVQSQSFVAS